MYKQVVMVLRLTEASTVIYYSNNYDLEKRLQSEDRAHRIGQTNKVTYIDLVAKGTVDEKIVKALRNKLDLAQEVLGDDKVERLDRLVFLHIKNTRLTVNSS
jgi:SNF2 family DNA or RNA helicase